MKEVVGSNRLVGVVSLSKTFYPLCLVMATQTFAPPPHSNQGQETLFFPVPLSVLLSVKNVSNLVNLIYIVYDESIRPPDKCA